MDLLDMTPCANEVVNSYYYFLSQVVSFPGFDSVFDGAFVGSCTTGANGSFGKDWWRSTVQWKEHPNLLLVHFIIWIFLRGQDLSEPCTTLEQSQVRQCADTGPVER